MLVTAFTGFALTSPGAVASMSTAVVQHFPVKQPSVTGAGHWLQRVSSLMPTAGPAAADPLLLFFQEIFLQSQPLAKEAGGLLLGGPGDCGCPIGGPTRAAACCGP